MPFPDDIVITALDEQRSRVVEYPVYRIYFQLSQIPPLGWAYQFSLLWESMTYEGKAPARIEEGAVWIECPPEEAITLHLAVLNDTVVRANAVYQALLREKSRADWQSRELNRQAEAQLRALAEHLRSREGFTESVPTRPKPRRKACRKFLRWLNEWI